MTLERDQAPRDAEPELSPRQHSVLDRLPPPIQSDPSPGALRAMLHLGYDVLWIVAALLGSPWIVWKCARSDGFAAMLFERAGGRLPAPLRVGARPRILVHGVSVGEVKAAQSVVRGLEREHPGCDVVVSSTTNTGMHVARTIFGAERVVRFPFDVGPIVRRFLRRVRPACVVLVELEIWPNLLRQANQAGVPVAVVNGRITDRSFSRYRLFRWLLPQFNRMSLYCVQAEEYAARFVDLYVAPERLVVTGNVKVDGLEIGPVAPGPEFARLLGGRPGQRVIVAGSTHEPEERWVIEAWRAGASDARLVLVPRHPRRSLELVRDLAAAGTSIQLLSRLRAGEPPDPTRPALVDTIGELERVYGLADVVFVGGSLVPHGGQNMLEPAAQGLPVLFGPHVANFVQEARLLVEAGACRQVADADELGHAFSELLGDALERERMSAAGLRAVAAQRGATELTLRALARACVP